MKGKRVATIISKNIRQTTDVFETIYSKFYKLVYFVVFSYLKNEEITEDIVQDVFLSFFQKAIDYEWLSEVSNIKSYLCACAKNAAIKEIDKRNKIVEIDDSDNLLIEKDEVPTEFDLRQALADIDCESINIVVDHIYLDLSFKEISEKSGSSINTIKSKYRRTLQKIRRNCKK